MYKAYIEPDLETAHLRIYNTFNPFSGFMNATYILKSNKPITKQAIKECLKVRPAQLIFEAWVSQGYTIDSSDAIVQKAFGSLLRLAAYY